MAGRRKKTKLAEQTKQRNVGIKNVRDQRKSFKLPWGMDITTNGISSGRYIYYEEYFRR